MAGLLPEVFVAPLHVRQRLAASFHPGVWLTDEGITTTFSEIQGGRYLPDHILTVPAASAFLIAIDASSIAIADLEPVNCPGQGGAAGVECRSLIICPINDSDHWSLLVACRSSPGFGGGPWRCCHYDPLAAPSNRTRANVIAKRMFGDGVRLEAGACAKQTNTYDCGVYLLKFSVIILAACLSSESPDAFAGDARWREALLEVTPQQVTAFRKQLLAKCGLVAPLEDSAALAETPAAPAATPLPVPTGAAVIEAEDMDEEQELALVVRISNEEERARQALTAAKKAAVEKVAADKAEAERVVAEKAAAKKAAAEKAAAEKAEAERVVAEKVAAKKAAAEKAAAEKVEAERVVAEKAAAKKAAAEKAAAEKAEAENLVAEKAAAKKAATEKAAAETVEAGRVVAEKAAAQKVAEEKVLQENASAKAKKMMAEKAAAQKAAEEKVAQEKAAAKAEKSVAEKAASQKLAEEKVVQEKAASKAEKSVARKAASQKVAEEKVLQEKAASKAEKSVGEKAASQKVAAVIEAKDTDEDFSVHPKKKKTSAKKQALLLATIAASGTEACAEGLAEVKPSKQKKTNAQKQHSSEKSASKMCAIVEKVPVVQAAVCLRPECAEPSWNGSTREFCSKTCRRAVQEEEAERQQEELLRICEHEVTPCKKRKKCGKNQRSSEMGNGGMAKAELPNMKQR